MVKASALTSQQNCQQAQDILDNSSGATVLFPFHQALHKAKELGEVLRLQIQNTEGTCNSNILEYFQGFQSDAFFYLLSYTNTLH